MRTEILPALCFLEMGCVLGRSHFSNEEFFKFSEIVDTIS